MMLPNLSMLAIDAEQEYKKYTNFVGTGCGYEGTKSTPGGSSDRMSSGSETYDSQATEQDPLTPPGTPGTPELTVVSKPLMVDMEDSSSSTPVSPPNNEPGRRKRCFSESSDVQRVREILDTMNSTETQIPWDDVDSYAAELKNLDTANMESDLKEEIMNVLLGVEQTPAVLACLEELGKS